MRFRGTSDTRQRLVRLVGTTAGIVRDVWLTFNEPALIRRQQIRVKLDGPAAEVEDRVFLENTSARATQVKLTLSAYAPGNAAPTATAQQAFSLAPGAHDQSLRLRLDSPKLWHFDHPNLYRMEAVLADAKDQPLDAQKRQLWRPADSNFTTGIFS